MPENASEKSASFAVLLEQICDGSQEAAAEFLRIYGPPILRVVRRRLHEQLRSRYDSIDFEQSVWASFFARDLRTHKFAEPEALVTYLVRMAENKVIDAMRQGGSGKRDIRLECPLQTDSVWLQDAVRARVPTPSQVAVAREEMDRLLKGRPEHHQQILTMRHSGYSYEEIAAEVGVAVKTVRRVLDRASRD